MAHKTGIVQLTRLRYFRPLALIPLTFEQPNEIPVLLHRKGSSVGFCGTDGCKFATTGLDGISLAIARSVPFEPCSTFYFTHILLGDVNLLTRQADTRFLSDEHTDTGKCTLGHALVHVVGA